MSRSITVLVSGHLDQVRRRLAASHAVGVLTAPAVGIDLHKVVALGCPWASDNGCFGQFDPHAYLRLCACLRQLDRRAFRWLVIPDVVADHRATVRRFLIWYPILRRMGLAPDELAFVLPPRRGDRCPSPRSGPARWGVQARGVRHIRRRNTSEQEGGRTGTPPRLR